MLVNYAITDLLGISVAFGLFPALAFFPGYLVAHLLNLWQFRRRTLPFQIAASVPLSLSIGPLCTFFAWRFAWILYLAATAWALSILLRGKPRLCKTLLTAGLVALAWSACAAVWLMDWQFSTRVYFPIYALDYSTRAAMVHALATFGLPAQTPFFYPGHPVALHYHFFWLLQCALIHSLAPSFITARLAFIAGAIWCGIGLMCTAALAMRLLMHRRSWIVIGLLAITGLDIIPAIVILIANRLHLLGMLPPSAEWWNEQVDGWIYTSLWEPHYICALIACITGLLVIWQSRRLDRVALAAVCFASAVGSGSFVALIFAAFLAVWMITNLRNSFPLAWVGILTVILSIPYLNSLRGPAQNAGGDSLFKLTVRPFSPFPLPALYDLFVLPLNYFLELGFFAACVWIGYRRKLATHERMLMTMAMTSMIICTFVKSGATPNNDLGWRGFLIAQFALLILSAAYLEQARPTRLLKLLIVLGLSGTVYDLILTRLFPILSDSGQVSKLKWLALDQRLGERTLANRNAYRWLSEHSSEQVILAQNPDVDSVDLFYGLYADRGTVAGDRSCTVGFGGNPVDCTFFETKLTKLFKGEDSPESACPSLPVKFVTVKDSDPVWKMPGSWVWTATPVFANQFVRIFACGGSNRTE
jgi:hypothetical protein